MIRPTWILCNVALIATLFATSTGSAADVNIRVTVVTILASDKHTHVCKELQEIAPQLQAKEPKLTGFTLERTTSKSMKLGAKDMFHLVDMEFAEVKLREKDDKQNRVSLTIRPPTLGDIEYTTCCGKYFPVFTGYRDKERNELVIIAVMVKPCSKK